MDLEQKRLLWQCRRGIKEVEVLLVPYFEKHYNRLDEAGKKRFQMLLDQSDVELFEWFTRRSIPENNDLEIIVNAILSSVDARS